MTERQAFVNAIKAHPRDFTPRLVFADWLDEQPDPTDLDRATADQPIARVYDPWARVDPAEWGIGDILPGLLPDQLPHPLP